METNIPSAARLSRIETILTNEPAFKGKLGKKSVTIEKRDGSKAHYCQEVVNVGIAIQAAGKDAVALSKADILGYATKIVGVPGAEIPAPAATTPTTETPVESGAEAPPVDAAPAKAEPADAKAAGPKVNYAIPVLSLIVGTRQMVGFMSVDSAKSSKVTKLARLLEEAQELASELQ